MSNLFSVFSPESWLSLNLGWVSLIFPLMVIPGGFWACGSRGSVMVKAGALAVYREFSAIFGVFQSPGSASFLVTLFLVIAFMNLWGMIPYVFTVTAHPAVAFSLALPLWLGANLRASAIQPNFMLAHLIPSGTPGVLIPFMGLIELLSSLMRPLTLGIRLTANMVAGHLLFALVGGQASPFNLGASVSVLGVLVLLAVLELSVAVIQAFVFSLLNTLYMNELQTFSLMRS